MNNRRKLIHGVAAIVLAVTLLAEETAAESFLFTVGFNSDNVVRFELTTGDSEVIANFAANDRPRGLALDLQGDIYVGLLGGTQNIVKLIPDPIGSDLLIPIGFTDTIGGFGPGLIAFNDAGNLIAAGDASRVVFRYDGATGELIDSFTHSGCCNILGLTVDAHFVYATEFFQRKVLRFDLSLEPVSSEMFIAPTTLLDRPLGMTIGHTGNVFVANAQSTLVQEFDSTTGAHVGTWLDVSTLGFAACRDIAYVPGLDSYFVTEAGPPGDSVLRLDTAGILLAVYQSDQLDGAYAIATRLDVVACQADINGDNVVNVLDLLRLLICFGLPAAPSCTAEDVNSDGVVNVLDLIELLLEFGSVCL